MKVVCDEKLNENQNLIVNEIANECGITFNTASILFRRGINCVDKAKRFLSPGKKWFYDPYRLKGVKEAVERLILAKERKEKVLIFGDYDADGICATTLTYYSLEYFGIESYTLIPERIDGYGLNVELIKEKFSDKGISLILTVDCGITDFESIKTLKTMGIDVLVTDHHIPLDVLPDCICINPKIKGQDYPFDVLCGAGVAYKLCYALIGEKANDFLDYVALATVADSMDLVDENRDLVVEGLKIFNSKKIKPAFSALLNNTIKKVTSQTLAYSIAPRINAGGRMGDANATLKLFLSSKASEIFDYAVKLNEYNAERQTECENIFLEAKNQIATEELDKFNAIIVANKTWRVGLLGIVASKLVEDYNKPVIVFAFQNGAYKGSARSPEYIDVFNAISSAKDLTIEFGGHSGAAGVSILEENINLFRERLSSYLEKDALLLVKEKEIYVDMRTNELISLDFAKEIELLEPFGIANRKPVFSVIENSIISKPLKEGSPHYSFNTKAGQMLDFNGEKNVYKLSLPIKKELLYELNLSTFNGVVSLKGYLKKIIPVTDDVCTFSPYCFYNNLKIAGEKECDNVKYVSYKDVKIVNGVGTLYLLFDVNNAVYYDLSSLEKFVNVDDSGNFFNKIIIAPESIPMGYKNIVYLDKPLNFIHNSEKAVCTDLSAINGLKKLSVDREDLIKSFNTLSSLVGEKFLEPISFVLDNFSEEFEQNLFSLIVFMELGFFSVEKGRLFKENANKSALTNSYTYCKISSIKG